MTKQREFNQACVDGDLQIVKALINDPDVDPSYVDNHPIRRAASDGHKDIVKLLMQDPRVDSSAANNWAICYASFFGHKDIVKLLLNDKRVMDKIDYALKWCEGSDGHKLLKGCMERQEKERRIQEAIREMSADCEMYF